MNTKRKQIFLILSICLPAGIVFVYQLTWNTHPTTPSEEQKKTTQSTTIHETASHVSTENTTKATQVLLDVPLESQFTDPALNNGCEVTALSMLLNYYGYDTTKNELATQLAYVPVFNADGTHGDPNEGFVGEIAGGDWAMGVFVPPIATLAKTIVDSQKYSVHSEKGADFSSIIKALDSGSPVWTLVTVEFQVPTEEDFVTWTTNNGQVTVSPLIHACIVTGYDADSIYVNDPYGHKNRKVPQKDFKKIFKSMGGQLLYLEK